MNEITELPPFELLFEPTMIALRKRGGMATIEQIERDVAEHLKLSRAALSIPHQNDRRTQFEYRLAWVRTYLKRVGAVENPSRGTWRITPHGERLSSEQLRMVPAQVRSDRDKLEPEEASSDSEDDPDVEVEHKRTSILIDRPFDPEKIKVKTKPILVDSMVTRIGHGEIDLAPDFQRQAGIWNQVRKARLIESLLLRIPLPVFYVAADEAENWAVVDGLQRMTTINDYVYNRFALSDLEYLTQFNEFFFQKLPRPMQRRIRETELVVHIIEPGTPEEVMFNIFSRINTGGLRLNGQEIRHALHKGPVREFLKRLAESSYFVRATSGSIRSDRMADRECVLRFAAFNLEPWEDYKANDLDGFLGESMNRLNKLSERRRAELERQFYRALNAAHQIFGNDAFRKRYAKADGRNPVSKALFEAWSVGLSRCDDTQINTLIKHNDVLISGFIDLMRNDQLFGEAISYSTGDPARVKRRFGAIDNLILATLEANR